MSLGEGNLAVCAVGMVIGGSRGKIEAGRLVGEQILADAVSWGNTVVPLGHAGVVLVVLYAQRSPHIIGLHRQVIMVGEGVDHFFQTGL